MPRPHRPVNNWETHWDLLVEPDMLNIKDPEAHRLAKGLAELEDTTLTEAVIRSLRHSLAEHAVRRSRHGQYLENEVAAARGEGFGMESDPIADLYDDDTSLPR